MECMKINNPVRKTVKTVNLNYIIAHLGDVFSIKKNNIGYMKTFDFILKIPNISLIVERL